MKHFTCNVCGKKAEKSYSTFVYTPGYNEVTVNAEGYDNRENEEVHLCLPHLIEALKDEEKRRKEHDKEYAKSKKM
jgi:hypothetical protein